MSAWLRLLPPALLLLEAALLQPLQWTTDAVYYAQGARALEEGAYVPAGNPVAHRVGLIAPLALCYRLFGFGEWAASAAILISAVGLVVAGQSLAARLFGVRAGLVAGLLLATCPLVVLNSVSLMGDVPVAFACAAALAWTARYRETGRLTDLAAAGAALGIGFWIKETAAFTAVFVGAWLLGRRPRSARAVAVFAAAAALPVVLGAAWLAAATGDPWGPAREQTVTTLAEQAASRMRRWTVGFAEAAAWPGAPDFALIGPLAWLFAASALLWRTPGWGFAAGAAAVPAMLLNFLPMSLDPAMPMFVAYVRYLSIVLAPLAAGAALGLVRLAERRRALALGAGLLVVAGSLYSAACRSALLGFHRRMDRELVAELRARGIRAVACREADYFRRATRMLDDPERPIVWGAAPGSEAALVWVDKTGAPPRAPVGWRCVWSRRYAVPPSGRERLWGGAGAPRRQEVTVWVP